MSGDTKYSLSSLLALNLSSDVVSMTKNGAQEALQRFCTDKWLVERNGILALGIRTVTELGFRC